MRGRDGSYKFFNDSLGAEMGGRLRVTDNNEEVHDSDFHQVSPISKSDLNLEHKYF